MTTSWVPGKVALVTGASGAIGTAVTRLLVTRGAHVFVTSRDDKTLQKLLHDHPEVCGGVVSALDSEQACSDCVKNVIAQSDELLGGAVASAARLDLFVHCAGATLNRLALRTGEADLRDMYWTNTMQPVLVAKHALRQGGMLARKDGCCVAIGSVVGEDGNAGQVAYSASKGALVSAWKSMSREFGTKNVRFNVVAPGLVESTMADGLSKEQQQAFVQRTALGRLVTPDEVADAVLACCSFRGMTGQVVRIDGGSV